jgi:Family of unknown function (DUF5996)
MRSGLGRRNDGGIPSWRLPQNISDLLAVPGGAAPEPPGFEDARIRPAPAFYSAEFNNFLLLYDDVRSAADPHTMVLEFLQSTYEAAATLGQWDRENLEFR